MSTRACYCTVTPMIPAGPNLSDALRFFTEHMGFTTLWQGDGMAGIQRDSIEFNLVQNDIRAWADNASFSIGVSDLDALHAEYTSIPAKVGPLELKPWGQA